MEAHMTAKYGEFDYEIEYLHRSGFDLQVDYIYAYVKGKVPDEYRFKVQRARKEDGTYEFSDTYFNLLLREEYQKFMEAEAKPYLGEIKCYMSRDTFFPNDFTSMTTFDEAVIRTLCANVVSIYTQMQPNS
jgi:hypothetical protein